MAVVCILPFFLQNFDLIYLIGGIFLKFYFILAWFFPLAFCCNLDLPYICNFAGMTVFSYWMNSYSLDSCVYWLHFMKHVVVYLCCFISKFIFFTSKQISSLGGLAVFAAAKNCSLVLFITEFSEATMLCYCIYISV